jgi:predicted DNA-binding antitoxin AbrB/MazE fold protein
MTIRIRAVFEHGVLRPLEPLSIPEGDTVDVTIARPDSAGAFAKIPTPEEEDYARRLRTADSLDEMFAVMAMASRLPEGYDLCQALDANRRALGERLLYPDPDNESQP